MDFINSAGIQPVMNAQPRACFCHTANGFSNARGGIFVNTCKRCGCHCASGNQANNNANFNVASNANHKS